MPASVAPSGFASRAFWIFVGVLFFGRAMDRTGLARRISYQFIVPGIETFSGSPPSFVAAMALAVAAMRFLDPIGFITIAAFFLSLAGFAAGPGIPPLVLAGTILLPLHVFWFNYQNIWIVMTEGISGRQGYTDAHRIRFATVFLDVTIVALWISAGCWRLIGLVRRPCRRRASSTLAAVALLAVMPDDLAAAARAGDGENGLARLSGRATRSLTA